MPVLLHGKSITYADCTDTNKLRPSDWNSSHDQHWTLQGNTLGASTLSGTNIQLAGGNNITLSVAGQTISIIGSAGGAGGVNVGIKYNEGDSTANTTFTSGTIVFSNEYATGGDLSPNINFKHSNQTISAALYPQELSNDVYMLFGRSDVNDVPYLQIWKSDSWVDMYFPMTGSSINNLVFPSFTDGASRTLEIAGHTHTYAASDHSHGNPTLALTNLNGTTASNSAGLTLSLSAAGGGGFGGLIASNSTWTSGTVQVSGNGNVTVSYNANTILISAGGGGGGAAISAAGASASNGTVVFSNSNNVSFAMNGSTITASASYSQSTGPAAIVGGTQTLTSGSVWITGSNNVTISGNGQSIIVSGANTHAQQTGISSIVASNTTITSGGVTFTGVNNITVTYNGQTISISGANTHGQQTGISGIAGSGASTVTNGTVQFANGNNVSFGLNGSTMTASASYSAETFVGGIAGSGASTVTNGTVVFSNLNGVSFGLNGSTMTASIQTSYAASNHSHGNPTLALTNLSGTTASNSAGLTLSLSANDPGAAALALSAAGSSQNAGTIVFSNSNGVSFGMNGSTITATAAAGAGGVALSAGTTAATSGTVVFSNSNSISFGLNGQTITASAAFADAMVTLTAGNLMSLSISTTSVSATVTFINLLSSSATAVGVNSVSSAGTLASRFALADHQHALAFSNTNGVSFGWNAGTVTASVNAAPAAGIAAIDVGGSSVTSETVQFANTGNVTFGFNGSTITASAPAGGGGSTLSMKNILDWCGGFNTGSAVSSEGTGYIFQPFKLEAPLSMSNIWMIGSISGNTSSSSNSSGQQAMSYAKSAWFFSRVNYGASSGSISYYTSASFGLSATRSHTSNSFSISMSWITDSTGGTSSNSTYSTGTVWQSGFFSGPHIMAMPLVTSFSAGEWFVGWRHSSTTATTGSNAAPIGISAFIHSIQSGIGMVLPAWGNTLTNRSNIFFQIGLGSATAITTNAAMDATVISAGATAQRPQHALLVNMGVN